MTDRCYTRVRDALYEPGGISGNGVTLDEAAEVLADAADGLGGDAHMTTQAVSRLALVVMEKHERLGLAGYTVPILLSDLNNVLASHSGMNDDMHVLEERIAEQAAEIERRKLENKQLRTETGALQEAVRRYCDPARMGFVEPQSLQQIIDRAITDVREREAELSEHKAVLAEVVRDGDAVLGLIDHLLDMQAIDWPDGEEEKMFSWLKPYRTALTRATALLEKADG